MNNLSNRQLRDICSVQFLLILKLLNCMDTIITEAEQQANERLARLIAKQVEQDGKIVDNWQDNFETVLSENEELQQKLNKARMRRKEARRLDI